MRIIKRDGQVTAFNPHRIENAITLAFKSVSEQDFTAQIQKILTEVTAEIIKKDEISVEEIQDIVERRLMSAGHYEVAKNYIKYRAQHEAARKQLEEFAKYIQSPAILEVLEGVKEDFTQPQYTLELLHQKFLAFTSLDLPQIEQEKHLIKAAVELTSKDAPKWEFIAARLLNSVNNTKIDSHAARLKLNGFYQKLKYLEEQNLLGKYILQNYTEQDVYALERKMDFTRDNLFTYSALDLVIKRYLIRTGDGIVLEKPQEMFMAIAMHLAMPEGQNKLVWAEKIYNIISKLQVTLATPTMSNARKPYHQLSSCFIDTVPDSLDGIYRSIDNFAKVSKFGGGMGMYFGKVRATGSDIRGFAGVAGGVIRWIKLANDTAVAVDQLGVRQGSVAVYLDAWHKDLPEFLQLRTNNGDDRLKAHDVFPGVCYPDYFWHLVETNIEADWHLMCPHEILKVKGYALEDSFGDDWKQKYLDCVEDSRIEKRLIKVKDLVRLIIKSVTETGTPFTFFRDAVNAANPNGHKGVIYSSNLCTEIAQNMSEIKAKPTKVVSTPEGEVVVTEALAGDFVVCNLASLVLGNIKVEEQDELKEIIHTVVRALDNVIDLNFYPVPYAQITNQKYRSIGLGISGYHHMLAKRSIKWESQKHLDFVNEVMENINYFAVQASNELAKEKGSYKYFEGSDWQTGAYFDKRDYLSPRWAELRQSVAQGGLRNAYLLAVAPTSSTSIIAGTTASVDPVMNRYFLEEKKGIIVPRVAPDLTPESFWYYKSAHTVDQVWLVRAAGVRQRHIDQAQSLNLYITTDYTMRQVLNLFTEAWKCKVKSIYYVRSKSLEVEECEVCAS